MPNKLDKVLDFFDRNLDKFMIIGLLMFFHINGDVSKELLGGFLILVTGQRITKVIDKPKE